ncbi:Rho-type gtpase-activating protein [Balamuthia mandrillaris]
MSEGEYTLPTNYADALEWTSTSLIDPSSGVASTPSALQQTTTSPGVGTIAPSLVSSLAGADEGSKRKSKKEEKKKEKEEKKRQKEEAKALKEKEKEEAKLKKKKEKEDKLKAKEERKKSKKASIPPANFNPTNQQGPSTADYGTKASRKKNLELKLLERPDEASLLARGVMKKTRNIPLFGVPLPHVMYTSYTEFELPTVFVEAAEFLRQCNRLSLEGLFRVSGGQGEVNQFKEAYDKGLAPNFSAECNPHSVSSLLKQYFRELPEPLLTFNGYHQFCDAMKEGDEGTKFQRVSEALHALPPLNYCLLDALVKLLTEVTQFSSVNFMTEANLGIVFGPTLLRDEKEDMMSIASTPEVVEFLILNYQELFQSEGSRRVRMNTTNAPVVAIESKAPVRPPELAAMAPLLDANDTPPQTPTSSAASSYNFNKNSNESESANNFFNETEKPAFPFGGAAALANKNNNNMNAPGSPLGRRFNAAVPPPTGIRGSPRSSSSSDLLADIPAHAPQGGSSRRPHVSSTPGGGAPSSASASVGELPSPRNMNLVSSASSPDMTALMMNSSGPLLTRTAAADQFGGGAGSRRARMSSPPGVNKMISSEVLNFSFGGPSNQGRKHSLGDIPSYSARGPSPLSMSSSGLEYVLPSSASSDSLSPSSSGEYPLRPLAGGFPRGRFQTTQNVGSNGGGGGGWPPNNTPSSEGMMPTMTGSNAPPLPALPSRERPSSPALPPSPSPSPPPSHSSPAAAPSSHQESFDSMVFAPPPLPQSLEISSQQQSAMAGFQQPQEQLFERSVSEEQQNQQWNNSGEERTNEVPNTSNSGAGAYRSLPLYSGETSRGDTIPLPNSQSTPNMFGGRNEGGGAEQATPGTTELSQSQQPQQPPTPPPIAGRMVLEQRRFTTEGSVGVGSRGGGPGALPMRGGGNIRGMARPSMPPPLTLPPKPDNSEGTGEGEGESMNSPSSMALPSPTSAAQRGSMMMRGGPARGAMSPRGRGVPRGGGPGGRGGAGAVGGGPPPMLSPSAQQGIAAELTRRVSMGGVPLPPVPARGGAAGGSMFSPRGGGRGGVGGHMSMGQPPLPPPPASRGS